MKIKFLHYEAFGGGIFYQDEFHQRKNLVLCRCSTVLSITPKIFFKHIESITQHLYETIWIVLNSSLQQPTLLQSLAVDCPVNNFIHETSLGLMT